MTIARAEYGSLPSIPQKAALESAATPPRSCEVCGQPGRAGRGDGPHFIHSRGQQVPPGASCGDRNHDLQRLAVLRRDRTDRGSGYRLQRVEPSDLGIDRGHVLGCHSAGALVDHDHWYLVGGLELR